MDVDLTNFPTFVSLSASGSRFPLASRSSVMVLNLTTLNILLFLPGRSWKKKAPAPLFAKWSQAVTAARGSANTSKAHPEATTSRVRLKKSRYGFISLSGTGDSRKGRRGGRSARKILLSFGYAVFSISAVHSMVVLGGDARCLRILVWE